MKNKNEKGGFSLKDNPELIREFLFLLCFIFILLLIYMVGGVLLTKDHYQKKSDTAESDAFFSGCALAEKDCATSQCNLYTWCGDGTYQTCRIYDCGSTYGIYTKDVEGQVRTRNEAKSDMMARAEKEKACHGIMQILEQGCKEGKFQAKVKLTTQGECEIGSFALFFEDGVARPNEFVRQEDGTYVITSYYCGALQEIVPGTKEGIALDFLIPA
jgi:hypothetical protein